MALTEQKQTVRLDEMGGIASRTVPVRLGRYDMTIDPHGPGVIDTYTLWPYER